MHVAVEFANLLKWTRDILERLECRDGGLLPAMAPRLRTRAVPLQQAFENIAERLLANYTLHGGLVVQPFEGAQVMKDGRVVMRVPDRPNARVPSRFHLEYQKGRDVLIVAREIVKATEAFVGRSAPRSRLRTRLSRRTAARLGAGTGRDDRPRLRRPFVAASSGCSRRSPRPLRPMWDQARTFALRCAPERRICRKMRQTDQIVERAARSAHG